MAAGAQGIGGRGSCVCRLRKQASLHTPYTEKKPYGSYVLAPPFTCRDVPRQDTAFVLVFPAHRSLPDHRFPTMYNAHLDEEASRIKPSVPPACIASCRNEECMCVTSHTDCTFLNPEGGIYKLAPNGLSFFGSRTQRRYVGMAFKVQSSFRFCGGKCRPSILPPFLSSRETRNSIVQFAAASELKVYCA